MTEIFFPQNPRPREDPASAGVVQANLEYVMQLFQKGIEDGDILVWDKLVGRWLAKSAGGIELATSLPLVDLYPGRELILTNNPASPGYLWHLRYNADSPSPYKWEFMGGSPALSVVSPWEGTFSTGFVDLSTLGPDFQIPTGIGGDFLLDYGAQSRQGTFGREARMATSAAIGLENAAISTMNDFTSVSIRRRFNSIASSTLIRAKYATSNPADEASFRERWLSVQPYRVG
jgi:hypothetical protein